jgi:hypothetical protein
VRFSRPEVAADDLAETLRATCALADTARDLKRAQIRLEHPALDSDQVEAMLVCWLQTRPGAVHGDGVGRPARWPRA